MLSLKVVIFLNPLKSRCCLERNSGSFLSFSIQMTKQKRSLRKGSRGLRDLSHSQAIAQIACATASLSPHTYKQLTLGSVSIMKNQRCYSVHHESADNEVWPRASLFCGLVHFRAALCHRVQYLCVCACVCVCLQACTVHPSLCV